MTMKRLLGPLLLAPLLVLTACGGDDASDVASDPVGSTSSPATSTPSTPSESPTGKPSGDDVDFDEIAILSQTAAGGQVSTTAVELGDPAQMEAFVNQFEFAGFGDEIARKVAATTVPEGQVLIGAVVSIGCDVPPGVEVAGEPGSWTITPLKVADPLPECLAPVTSVAIVAVPAA
jgi:hypothetical protein